MRLVKCEQGSAEWLDARKGKITASRIADVLDQLKRGGEGACRRNYRIEIIAERLSGRTEDHYTSPEMEWGTNMEPFARAAYEVEHDAMVDQVGFVLHPTLDFAGASPDGLVGTEGCFEAKCPKTTTHIKWMLADGVPEEHQPQCLWVMACTGRKWCDFASYDPRLPDGLRLFVRRMERDDERIANIEQEVIRFNEETEAVIAELRKKVKDTPSPEASTDDRSAFDELMAMIDQEIVP